MELESGFDRKFSYQQHETMKISHQRISNNLRFSTKLFDKAISHLAHSAFTHCKWKITREKPWIPTLISFRVRIVVFFLPSVTLLITLPPYICKEIVQMKFWNFRFTSKKKKKKPSKQMKNQNYFGELHIFHCISRFTNDKHKENRT